LLRPFAAVAVADPAFVARVRSAVTDAPVDRYQAILAVAAARAGENATTSAEPAVPTLIGLCALTQVLASGARENVAVDVVFGIRRDAELRGEL
jgi:hypothetical protein